MPTGLELLAQSYAPAASRKRKAAHSPATDAVGNQAAAEEPAVPGTEPLLPKNQGALLSALQWIGRPGQVVKNLVTGNVEGAARQAGDFLGEAVDAVLPGDLIPQFSRPQDEIQGSAVLGFDDAWRKEHPFLNAAVSLPVDIATDPLTWTGFGPLAKAAGVAGRVGAKVASKLPRGAEAVQAIKDTAAAAGKGLRSITANQRLSPAVADAAAAASAAKSNVAEAGASEAKRLFQGFTAKELDVAGDVADGLLHDASGRPVALLPGDSLAERIAAHPEAAGMDPVRLEQVIRDSRSFMARQATEGGLGKPVANVNDMLKGGGRTGASAGAPDLPIFTAGPGIDEYLPRLYKGETEEDALAALVGDVGGMGVGKATKERTLLTPAAQIDYFAKNPKLTNVRNLAERIGNRVGQQAELGKRATLGRQILAAVKAGKITIPDSELQKIADWLGVAKPVRLGENTAADIAPRAASPGDTLFSAGLGGQSGKSPALVGNQAADLLGPSGFDSGKIYGVGSQSGVARPPSGAAHGLDMTGGVVKGAPLSPAVAAHLDTLAPADRAIAESAMAQPGFALQPDDVSRIRTLDAEVQAAKQMAELAARRAARAAPKGNPGGITAPSGTSRPPLEAASGLDLLGGIRKEPQDIYGVGSRSGVSNAPGQAASGLDILAGAGPKIGDDLYGIGTQSGKAMPPGGAVAQQAIEPMASLIGESKPISDLSRAVDRVMVHNFRLADPESRSIVNAAIKGMDPETARYASDMFNGIAPREGVMQGLSKVNRIIKPMMVYGYAIPKAGAMVRNVVSGAWQAFSNPATRGTAAKAVMRIVPSIYGAVVDSLGLKIGKDQLGKVISLYEDALKQSGGISSKAIAALEASSGAGGYTGKQIADVFRSGAPGGFVDTEAFLKTMVGARWKQKYKNIVEWPARMFKGLEDRMRIGMALELTNEGKSTADIGRFVKEALYDYDVTSAGNRAARDILPFAQYTFKAVPQQAKLLYEKPWLAVGLSSLLTEKEGQPTYPYMQGKLNVPLGTNEQGQRRYASGFGLPFEALSQIPNPSGSLQETGRDLERILGGSSQPLLKTAFGVVAGEDPYFETSFGTYSKLPGNIEGGALGRAYNVVNGTGLIQPLDAPLRLLGKLTDQRTGPGMKALDLLTGANVVSVNEDKALQQRLTDYLRRNPDVSSYESLYSRSNDPEVKALLGQLGAAKKRIRASRKAAAP